MFWRWKFSNLNFESKKLCRSIWRRLAVILQYFLCIISQVKYCYKARFGPYVQKQCKTANPCKTATQYMYVIIIISVLFPLSSAPSLRVQSTKRVQISCSLALMPSSSHALLLSCSALMLSICPALILSCAHAILLSCPSALIISCSLAVLLFLVLALLSTE